MATLRLPVNLKLLSKRHNCKKKKKKSYSVQLTKNQTPLENQNQKKKILQNNAFANYMQALVGHIPRRPQCSCIIRRNRALLLFCWYFVLEKKPWNVCVPRFRTIVCQYK